MQIKVENLSYVYSEKSKSLQVKALDNVSLEIPEGEFFGIIGKTGSGKSTFIQHLNGLIKIQKGRGKITVGEFDLTDKKCDFKSLRSKVGMVFQYPEYQLFAESVKDDVAFGLRNCVKGLSEEEIQSRVKSAVEICGLNYEEVKNKSPFELSGGQKRRVAIAGVLVLRPEVLVLDEPAAGLDPIGKQELIHFLRVLKEVEGHTIKTIVIVSHDMNLIAENCTKAAVFNGGKIVAVGTPKEVFFNTEILEKSGLELPLTAKLVKDLKDKGISVDCDLTDKDFTEKLVKELSK